MNEQTGDLCLTRIQGYSHLGEGVGRHQGKPVFVPLAIRGECIRFRIVQEKSNFLRGELLAVMEPCPTRSEPPCPLFPQCGGCQLQHQSYEEQLFFKQQLVASSIQRIGRLKGVEVNPVLGMATPWHYRHTARFHVALAKGRAEIGFFQGRSRSLQPIDACDLLPAEFPPLLKRIAGFFQERAAIEKFPVREVILRKGWGTGDLLVIFLADEMPEYIAADRLADIKGSTPSLVGILCEAPGKKGLPEQKVLWGRDYYLEKVAGITFQVPATSFFQNNPAQAEKLVSVVHGLTEPGAGETTVDLYCGVGLFTLTLASLYKRVYGIEENHQAVEAARQNARLNGVVNSKFLAGRVERALRKATGQPVQTLILDPPRQGCSPAALKAIIDHTPARIVYVSCNPSTLARDLAILTKQGYLVQAVQPVDMFPQTHHVECIVLMTNCGQKDK